jgi:hypothetical protein
VGAVRFGLHMCRSAVRYSNVAYDLLRQ